MPTTPAATASAAALEHYRAQGGRRQGRGSAKPAAFTGEGTRAGSPTPVFSTGGQQRPPTELLRDLRAGTEKGGHAGTLSVRGPQGPRTLTLLRTRAQA